MIWATTDNDRPLMPLLRPIDRSIRRMQRRGPRQEDMDRVIAGWETWMLQSLEDPNVLADALAHCTVYTGSPDCLADDMERYRRLTPDDVRRVANTYLVPERVVLSVLPTLHRANAIPGSVPVEAP